MSLSSSRGGAACAALAVAVAFLGSGCTTFREEHYFRASDQLTGATTNYFRLRIKGSSYAGRARYVAGYYDERAVDLFFNETKSKGGDDSDVRPVFSADLVTPGGTEKIQPLQPADEDGAFLMILSNNPKAVTNVIAQFVESDQVAEAVTNLANRSRITEMRRAASQSAVEDSRMKAVGAELTALLDLLPDDADARSEAACVRILNAIAGATGSSQTFQSLSDPKLDVWLELQRKRLEERR